LTEEVYLTEEMKQIRSDQIEKAKSAKLYGIILGTLGR
jgi:diphthamide biosynthesis enzyme Dph1/Dph2-like protein